MAGTNIAISSETFNKASDKSWLRTRMGLQDMMPIMLDISSFAAEHIAGGYLPSGIALGKITATNKYGPFDPGTSEIQSMIATGGTTGDFTLGFGGETTASIAFDATAAEIQAALETLASVNAGDIVCSGGPLPGTAVKLAFGGQYAGVDVPLLVVTDNITGGTATVTVDTAGGASGASDGRAVLRGHLFEEVKVVALTDPDVGAALFWTGVVRAARLPSFTGSGDGLGEVDAIGMAQVAAWIRYE